MVAHRIERKKAKDGANVVKTLVTMNNINLQRGASEAF